MYVKGTVFYRATVRLATVATKCLRWEHVQLYAFVNVDGANTLKVKVGFRNLNGSSGNTDDRSKTIPLRLLPLRFPLRTVSVKQ